MATDDGDDRLDDRVMDTRQYRQTWRLRFEYDGERLRLVRRTRVAMIAPTSPVQRPRLGESGGMWVELLGDDDRPLFHRVLSDPLRTRVEVHSPDRRPEVRFGDPQPGQFEVLVPDVPGARDIAVRGTPLDPVQARETEGRSVEIARFPLTEPDEPKGAS